MKIRLAEAKDAEAISNLLKEFKENYKFWRDLSESYIKEKIAFKNDFFLVAVDKKIIGVLRLSIVNLDLAEFRMMIIDDKYRSKGIGSMLVEEGLKFFKEKKMRKVLTRIKSKNESALELFKKHGFEQEGYFREHYRKGVDIIQLYKFI